MTNKYSKSNSLAEYFDVCFKLELTDYKPYHFHAWTQIADAN